MSRTSWTPFAVNVCVTFAPVASVAPSSSKSQAKLMASPLGSLEPDASKATVSGTAPEDGVAVNCATGTVDE